MALTVTGFSTTALDYKIVNESGSVNTMDGNVTGSSGSLYFLDIDNQVSAVMYIKVYTTANAVIADDPSIKFELASTAKEKIVFPDGLAFTELSFFSTTTKATSGSPSAPGGTVTITAVTS